MNLLYLLILGLECRGFEPPMKLSITKYMYTYVLTFLRKYLRFSNKSVTHKMMRSIYCSKNSILQMKQSRFREMELIYGQVNIRDFTFKLTVYFFPNSSDLYVSLEAPHTKFNVCQEHPGSDKLFLHEIPFLVIPSTQLQ